MTQRIINIRNLLMNWLYVSAVTVCILCIIYNIINKYIYIYSEAEV